MKRRFGPDRLIARRTRQRDGRKRKIDGRIHAVTQLDERARSPSIRIPPARPMLPRKKKNLSDAAMLPACVAPAIEPRIPATQSAESRRSVWTASCRSRPVDRPHGSALEWVGRTFTPRGPIGTAWIRVDPHGAATLSVAPVRVDETKFAAIVVCSERSLPPCPACTARNRDLRADYQFSNPVNDSASSSDRAGCAPASPGLICS